MQGFEVRHFAPMRYVRRIWQDRVAAPVPIPPTQTPIPPASGGTPPPQS